MISLKEVKKKLYDKTIAEGSTVELKQNFPKDLASIANIVAGMANSDGGFILLGIHENVNGVSVTGVDNIQPKQILLNLKDYLSYQPYKIGVITVDGKSVPYIEVDKADYPVYFQNNPNSERLYKYKRIGDHTRVVDKDKDRDGGKDIGKTKIMSRQNCIRRYINI